MSKIAINQEAIANRAYEHYQFGDGVTVTDHSGWEYTEPGNERSRTVYVETEPEDDGPAPRWKLTFTAIFAPQTDALIEAYARDDKGNEWGSMPVDQHLFELYSLWDEFSDVAVDEGAIETPFQHFPKGTPPEEIWRWFESQHSDFVVGEVQAGVRRVFGLGAPVTPIDPDDVAEWVGLHYGRNFEREPLAKQAEWTRRYAQAHGLQQVVANEETSVKDEISKVAASVRELSCPASVENGLLTLDDGSVIDLGAITDFLAGLAKQVMPSSNDAEHDLLAETIDSASALLASSGLSQFSVTRTSAAEKLDEGSMLVSVDGGVTFQPASQGVRIIYKDVFAPAEDEPGEFHINATPEGLIADLWVSREEHLDHNLATSSELLDDLVSRVLGDPVLER